MTPAQSELLSQLIGLARATDGSEHLITPQAVDTVTDALRALTRGDPEEATAAVIEAKRSMVPNCFTCAQPCGRTSPFDLSALEQEPEAIRSAKWEMADLLAAIAARGCTRDFARQYFFLGLIAIGTQPIAEEPLYGLLDILRQAAR